MTDMTPTHPTQASAGEERPTCAVRGSIRPGAMCSKVIVGGKFCGYAGECPHKVARATSLPKDANHDSQTS